MIMTYGFWGLLVALLILVIRRLAVPGQVSKTDTKESSQAFEILKQRYAKGEIAQQDFHRMKDDFR